MEGLGFLESHGNTKHFPDAAAPLESKVLPLLVALQYVVLAPQAVPDLLHSYLAARKASPARNIIDIELQRRPCQNYRLPWFRKQILEWYSPQSEINAMGGPRRDFAWSGLGAQDVYSPLVGP